MNEVYYGENVGLPNVTLIPGVRKNVIEVKNEVKKSGGKNVVTNVKQKIKMVKEEMIDNDKLRNDVENEVVKNMVIEELSHKVEVSKIKVEGEIRQFLLCQRSVHTSTIYERSINLFLDWSKKNGVKNVLTITSKKVDSYLCYINGKYSPRSVQTYLMGVCSFYKFLQYRYPKIILVNPFHNRKLPRINDVRRKDFPTDNDIEIVKNEFIRIDRKDIVCLIELLSKYGFRIGVFNEMIIRDDGKWDSISKGKNMSGKFTKKEVKQIYSSGLLGVRKVTLTNIILKYTHKLYDDKKISCPFSVHDLRRYFINKKSVECKNVNEFIQFSKTIHRNFSTTVGYL